MRFAAPDRTHVLPSNEPGRAVCGVVIDRRDVYDSDAAGELIWRSFPEDRCPVCERIVEARSPLALAEATA